MNAIASTKVLQRATVREILMGAQDNLTNVLAVVLGVAIGAGRADLVALDMRERTYGWPVEMLVKAARRGYRIVEVPVSCRPRVGRSKVGGTLRGSVLAGYHLLLTTLRYAWRR